MNELATFLPAISALLLIIVLILLIVLLVRQRRTEEDLYAHTERQAHDLGEINWRIMEELGRQRNETEDSLQDLNDSLLNTMSNIGQSQNTLLESMQRQILLSTRNQEQRSDGMSASIDRDLSRMNAGIEQFRQSLQSSMDQLRTENNKTLSDIRLSVDEKLTESLERRLNESFAQVSQRLETLYRSLGEMRELAGGVSDLKKILSNVKTRGIWGEIQLGNLISQILSPGQFEMNTAVVPGSLERVEFAIVLPGSDGCVVRLPIDSKFPQEDYLRLTEASDSGDGAKVLEARKGLTRRIREEAKRISSKYICPPYTTDYAIMFLPVEALYAEVVQSPALIEEIQRDQRIVVAGPSTFAAMLNALQMGFRTLAVEKRTGEVWQLLGEVKKDFVRFADTLDKTKQKLQQASESIDSACSRTRMLQKRLNSVEDAGPILPEITADGTNGNFGP